MIRLCGRLAEHLGQPDHRHGARGDDVGQHLARPDRRQLVDVADQDQGRPSRHRLEQRVHQRHVDHRDLVHHQQVAVERVLLVALEAASAGSASSSRCRVLASSPVASLIRLAARPVGAASAMSRVLARRISRMALTSVVLPTPGAAGDHQQLGAQRQPHRLPLALGQAEAGLLLDPG